MRLFTLVLLALAGLIRSASGEEERPRWNITAECQMVTLPQKSALALLPELMDESTIDAGFAKIQQLIETGEAKLVANLVGKAIEGEKVVAASVQEMKYATEFDPLPPSSTSGTEESLTESESTGVTPTAFETRHIGATLELVATAHANGTVLTVSLEVIHALLERWRKFVTGRKPNGQEISIAQPQFESLTNRTSFRMRNHARVLLGVHKRTQEPATIELFFLRVSAALAP